MNEDQIEFMEWLRENFPQTYQASILEAGGSGLNEITTQQVGKPSFWSKMVGAVESIAPKLIQFKAQRDILKTQLTRAKQGLPPLNTSNIAPTIRVQPELPAGSLDVMKKMILPAALIGGGLLVVLLIMNKKKK